MKLFKLSLAAVVAAGALSSVSAAPLEEAIKDIDVSGFGRYRFQGDSFKSNVDPVLGGLNRSSKETHIDGVLSPIGTTEKRTHDTYHRFTLDVNFKATLDDNFFAVIGLRYDSRDVVGSHTRGQSGLSNTHGGLRGINGGWGGNGRDSFSVRQYYVGFTAIPYTTVLFGRQPAGTFFTDDIVATGLKVAVNPVEGLTLAGLYYTNFEEDGDLGMVPFDPTFAGGEIVNAGSAYIHQKNLWGLAAIYQNEFLDLQAWYAGLNKVANLFALSAGVNYAINDDFSVRGKAQWAHTNLTGKFKDNYGRTAWNDGLVANSDFIAAKLGLTAYGFSADAGYLNYGKKDRVTVHTLEDAGSLIKAGEELINYTAIHGKHNTWFAKLGYTFDAYSIGVDYVYDKEKNSASTDVKGQEWVIRAGYKYNEKLSFSAWYSMVTKKTSDEFVTSYNALFNTYGIGNIKDKKNRFRFDARYNF